MSTTNTFNQLFAKLEDIPFSTSWKNNTGYLDNLVNDKTIPNGMTRFVDDTGRPGIIGKKDSSCLVVFKRYTNEDTVYVSNESAGFVKRLQEKYGEYPFTSSLTYQVDPYYELAVRYNNYLEWALAEAVEMTQA